MPDPCPILPETLILPEKTIFGRGKISTLFKECRRFGKRGLLVHGTSLGQRLMNLASPSEMAVHPVQHQGGEPTLTQVVQLVEIARAHHADWIAGVGGGSILDLAKAAAVLVHAPHPVAHYHGGATIEAPGLVFIAVPTTAGTGSEATINSVLTDEASGIKKSIRDIGMMARVVILDPDLLATCPRNVVAASGMDALTQGIEAYSSRHATGLSDQLALKSVTLIAANLEPVFTDPAAPEADGLLTGSYLGGVALSFARLGVVHGIAHPLGALYHIPHGQVCAACLPLALELNREAFGSKYDELSRAVGGDLIATVNGLTQRLGLFSPFAGQPLREADMIIRETLASGSTKANPKPISRTDVEWLLNKLWKTNIIPRAGAG